MDCPACGEPTLKRVLFPPTVLDATPKTVGSLADRNSGPGRQYWLDAQRQKLAEDRKRGQQHIQQHLPQGMSSIRGDIEKAPDPFWRGPAPVNTSLADLTPTQAKNYVVTGDSRG